MNTINTMEVICLKNHKKKFNQVTKKGERYFVDRNSIWINIDGDTFGDFYDCEGKYLGQYNFKHFQTVTMNRELNIYGGPNAK